MFIYDEESTTLENNGKVYSLNTGDCMLPEFVIYLVQLKEGEISLQEAFDLIKQVGIE